MTPSALFDSVLGAADRALRPLYMDLDQQMLRAAREGRLERVLTLLDAGADILAVPTPTQGMDVSEGGETALHHAVARGDLDMVQLLLSRGANPNAPRRWGETPWWDWLQKHSEHAWSRHPHPPPPLPDHERAIGLALLVHGASMQACVPQWQEHQTIQSKVSGYLQDMVDDLQEEVISLREAGMLEQLTPPPPTATRPSRRF